MEFLAESAVRVLVLAFGAAVILRALRIRSPRLAHRAWTTVAAVMLLLPFFVAWGPELAVPLLPPDADRVVVAPAIDAVAAVPSGRDMTAALSSDGALTRFTWSAVALTGYVIGAGLFLLRLVTGILRARAIRRGAVPVRGRLTHPACITPMTVGIISPVVILPPAWTTWSEAELDAVLAHEEEHVRQRDTLVAAVALLNRAVFWFHPLAWWLQRKIARLSEQACDAVVISRGHDRDLYAACLLRFARGAADAGGRIVPLATAMPGTGLRERLGMLEHQATPSSRSRIASGAVAGVVLVAVCGAAEPAARLQSFASPGSPAAWPVVMSEHFEIVHDNLPADRVSEAIRDVEAAYAQLSATLKHEMPRPVRVILVRRDRDIAVGADTVASHAGASNRDGRVVLSLESLDRRAGIALHELTHQFAFDIVPETSRIAPVLIEGLAEQQRGRWDAGDLGMTRTAAAAGAIPTLATLVNTDRHWAHAVFDFVAAQHGAEGVRRLLFALRAHSTLPEAVPMAFGVTLDQFDEAFRAYVTATFGQR